MILADTHTLMWLTDDQDQLSSEALKVLTASRSDGIAISSISLWEIAMLVKKRRVELAQPLRVYIRNIETAFVVLAINARVAERSMEFTPTYPRDPADRIIGATALVHGLTLVTRDEPIRHSGEVPCIW